MKPSRSRLLVAGGYLLLFAVAFYLTLVLTFPTRALERALAAAVEHQTGLTLVIGDLSPGWGGSLRAEAVALAWPAEERSVPVFRAQRVDLRFAVWPLLTGRLEVDLKGEAYGGRFEGEIEMPIGGPRVERVTLRLVDLDLARHPGLRELSRVAVAGRLSGELSLGTRGAASGPRQPQGDLSGTIRLSIADGSLRGLPVIGASLPVVTIERATASGRLEGNRLRVQAAELRGPEVFLSVSGQILLREPFAASVLNGTLRLRPEQRFPPSLRQLLASVARDPDAAGTYGFVLYGTLETPGIRPL